MLNNQKSPTDGTAATMFPFIDTGDPASELAQRTLDSDDIAFASFYYPEGTAATGPAALQPGDIPFGLVYGLIKGSVTHGVFNEPIAGASVSAINLLNGELVATAFSGTSQVSFDPATGGIFLVSPSYNILNGNYTLPVQLGLYTLGIEAVDGSPVPASSVSINAQIGDIFGQQNFNEEFWSGRCHSSRRSRSSPASRLPVAGVPGLTRSHIDFVTNDQINISNFGSRDFVGFTGRRRGATTPCASRRARSRRSTPAATSTSRRRCTTPSSSTRRWSRSSPRRPSSPARSAAARRPSTSPIRWPG